MMATVIHKELRAILRDGRFIVLALALLALLAGVLFVSAQEQRRLAQEKADALAAVRHQWDEQGNKHPHRGAHFGLYAFRADSPLAVIDPGLDAYLGQALWLEPHKRNMTRFQPAADALPSVRFGQFTPAFVLVTLLPLLLIAFSFDAVSRERESGSLRMLHGVGLSPRRLLGGKLAAILIVFGALAIGAVAAGLGLAASDAPASADAVWRGAALAAASLLYYTCFAAIALAVSAHSASSRAALFVLLGLWLAFAFVMPRVGAAAADRAVALPTPEAFWAAIQRDYAQGLPGDGDLATRGKRFDEQLLRQYGVARLEDMPLGALPLRRMARDAYANRVHALHFDDLWRRYAAQENILRLASVLSPTVAMRSLSMKLAGTDLAHQRHFEDAAEDYRRTVNTTIDQWDADHTRGVTSFDDKYGGNALWRSIKPFVYAPPPVGFALRSALPELIALGCWGLVALALLFTSMRRLQP